MDEITSLYKKNLDGILGAKSQWLSELRGNLLKQISIKGLPNKKDETWKYSTLTHINNIKYNSFKDKKNKYTSSNQDSTINVEDGKYNLTKKLKNNDDLAVNDLEESLPNLKDNFYFNKEIFINDFTIDINTIFLSNGLCISTKKGSNLYLIINYKNITKELASYLRNIITIKENSKLTLVENFKNSETHNNHMNIFNNFFLEQNSELEHIIIQNLNISSNLAYSSLTVCEEKSNFNQLSCQLGGISVKNQHTSNLRGRNSKANHNGIYFAKKDQFIDNKTTVIHHNEDCESNQVYKGVLKDESSGVYLSNTLVKPEAQKTRGYQLSRGLLLSDKSRLYTKPELKIYADDVKCSHGSTIGAIDKNQLFYLQSRGLSKKDSQKLLIKAFYKDVIKIINDNKSLSEIELIINEWLEKND